MALALPKLDNRNFDELLREAQRIIPQQAPQWTDHNTHDPGITLMELFAWLVEKDMYRLDRISDASVRAFLRLVGIEVNPAKAASTVLELTTQPGFSSKVIASGLVVRDVNNSISFETERDVYVSAAKLTAIASENTQVLIDHHEDNKRPGVSYFPFGANPVADNCLYLGFDTPLGQGGENLDLYIWSNGAEKDAGIQSRLIEEWQARLREARYHCPEDNIILPHWGQHYSARTVWEYWSSTGNWEPLENVRDETRGLTLSGFVRFIVPDNQVPGELFTDLRLIRCRLISGGYECPPRINRIAINTVQAKHAVLITEPETLGQSQGHAGEVYSLQNGPVVAGSVQLTVENNEGVDNTWYEVNNWDRTGAHDRVFLLDAEKNQIIFGDGRHGRVPPAGATLHCRYRLGGGSIGNIAARTLVNTTISTVNVFQSHAAFGGAEAETLDDARGKALAFLAQRYRAISRDDFEILALATPGIPVARARALVGHYPKLPCVSAPGNITVVAIPECPDKRPEASQEFLDAVYCWLLPRCSLTTELHVVGPKYKEVSVKARVHIKAGANAAAVVNATTQALNQFFHPLEGGPDNTGWPVGRAVYRSEVMAVLNEIEGAAFVDQLSLFASGVTKASCANLKLCADELVTSGEHRIQVIERR